MKKALIILCFISLVGSLLANKEFRTVTCPTASILDKGEYSFSTKFYGESSIRIGSNIGLFDRLNIGFCYGSEEFVGNKEAKFYDHVDFKAKFQILKETMSIPALTLGFDTEGHGKWYESIKRYRIKSPGAYLVIGKHDVFLKGNSIQIGMNRSFETKDEDDDFSGFITYAQGIGEDLILSLEYDLAFNDDEDKLPNNEIDKLGEGKGYLNFSAGWFITEDLQFKFCLYDLLDNAPNFDNAKDITVDRSFEIVYTTRF